MLLTQHLKVKLYFGSTRPIMTRASYKNKNKNKNKNKRLMHGGFVLHFKVLLQRIGPLQRHPHWARSVSLEATSVEARSLFQPRLLMMETSAFSQQPGAYDTITNTILKANAHAPLNAIERLFPSSRASCGTATSTRS